MATQQSVRHINLRRALDSLFRHGTCSRAELSRHLGMTRSATSALIADLIEAGLVTEVESLPEPKRQRTGRPGIDVKINPSGACFIGAEIGVDRLSVVVADLEAETTLSKSIPFPTDSVPAEKAVDNIHGLIREAIEKSGAAGPLRGVCVCLPALLRNDGTVINGLLLGWREVPLLAMLRERLGSEIPVAIENDANAFAFGETYLRPDTRDEVHAFFLLEAGVGGGVVIRGELFRGGVGLAGELGQTVVGGAGFDPGSVARPGHTESYVGREALLARWRQSGGPEDGTLAAFLDALDADDPDALAAARDWGHHLAIGITQATAVLNPDSIILGGSVSPVFHKVRDCVAGVIRSELLDGYPMPRIVVSTTSLAGPGYGAALLMHQRLFRIENGAFPGADQNLLRSS